MTEQRWQRVVELFEEALSWDADDRDARLATACGGDAALLGEVRALLAADGAELPELDATGAFEQILAAADGAEGLPDLSGTTIGPYRLTERLGEGGMGTVWAAEQEKPLRRSVALKLVKAGMDTRQVLGRFEAERQVLARMGHPHVARIHDAGATDDGRPYFVMERVDGTPITTFCADHDFDLERRLEILLPVCEAVQHAHHQGVIHRDLKPSNVLVTELGGRPHPIVIDFGIAKLVDAEGLDGTRTGLGGAVGTPSYMSPEQVAGEPVDTRTDVYSLGALLYEMLTGAPPLEVSDLTPTEAVRRIREDHPPTPSTRERHRRAADDQSTPSLTGLCDEVDWIVMKALEKDRDRRYATPLELAADIRRFLASEPVLAGPPSRLYRARTFVRRHRLAVSLASAAVVSLVLGLVGTTWMALEARSARDDAVREASSARAVSGFLTDVLSAADPLNPRGATPAREVRVVDVLEDAARRLDEDRGEAPEIRATLRQTLGTTAMNLSSYDLARSQLEAAYDWRTKNLGPDHPDTLASAHNLAVLAERQGRYDDAHAILEPTLEARRRVLGRNDPETLTTLSNFGDIHVAVGDLEAAEEAFREVLAGLEPTLGPDHPQTIAAVNNLGYALRRRGEVEEAEKLYREALVRTRRALGDEHPHTVLAFNNLAALVQADGRLDEAATLLDEALRRSLAVHGEDDPGTLNILGNLAVVRMKQDRLEEAENLMADLVDRNRRALGPDHPATLLATNNLARVISDRGRPDEAVAMYRDLMPAARKALPAGHPYLPAFQAGFGKVLAAAGHPQEARRELSEALAVMRVAFGEDHPSTKSTAAALAALESPAGGRS
jgi:non-specific serine/threonine protein kinase/serine/threonine-protein kinase